MGLSSSFGWASDHGEPRSAWWSAGILCFVVSVCLAGVMGSVCCWLALARPSRCEADVVPCFSGSIPVVFQVQSLWFFQVQSLWFFFSIILFA